MLDLKTSRESSRTKLGVKQLRAQKLEELFRDAARIHAFLAFKAHAQRLFELRRVDDLPQLTHGVVEQVSTVHVQLQKRRFLRGINRRERMCRQHKCPNRKLNTHVRHAQHGLEHGAGKRLPLAVGRVNLNTARKSTFVNGVASARHAARSAPCLQDASFGVGVKQEREGAKRKRVFGACGALLCPSGEVQRQDLVRKRTDCFLHTTPPRRQRLPTPHRSDVVCRRQRTFWNRLWSTSRADSLTACRRPKILTIRRRARMWNSADGAWDTSMRL